MKQMSDYARTESGKFGPRIFNKGSFRTQYIQRVQPQPEVKDRPILINPETKTWMVWDVNTREYIDSNISILKNESNESTE